MKFEKAKIYGVDQVGRSNPLNLPRTDDAANLTVTVDTSEIHSDFNRCYPWSDITEVVDSSGNVFVKIPKFYWKITKNDNGTYKHQISGIRYEGFGTLFIDGKGKEIPYVLVGKYEGSGSSLRVYSKTGQTVLVNTTIYDCRTGCRANGAGYQQYDFLIDMIIKELWLVEMATTNSQSIMYGYANGNSAAITTGSTNGVSTPSGSPTSNTTGKYAMKYRGIENLWGNTHTFVDGISFAAEKVYVSTDPGTYVTAKTTDSYAYQGDRSTINSFAKKIEPLERNPLIMFTTESSGASGSTYYCDYNSYNSNSTVLRIGGYWSSTTYVGLWFWAGDVSEWGVSSVIGCRLCFKPINGATLA